MSSRIGAGVVAGLAGGVVMGLMMHLLMVPALDGTRMPMIALVGSILGPPSVVTGWLYHLFNSAIFGALFGWLLGTRVFDYTTGLGWGAAYGLAWWVIGGLILMPTLLGMPAFAPLMPGFLTIGLGSLFGHLAYGVVTGDTFAYLYRYRPARYATSVRVKGPQ